jgi:repressor LexA
MPRRSHTRPHGKTRERIYRFVRERLLAGQPPTMREVQRAVGLKAVESARSHLQALVADGRLAKEPGKARGYRLPRTERMGDETYLVPLLGHVQAGDLTTAVEEPEGYLSVQRRGGAEGLFALHVRGDSMRDAGILEGDVVIVRQEPSARSGDIVVALVGEEATVKRLRRTRRGRVELHPENPDFEPIVPDPREVSVLGRVVEVRRYLDS